MQRLPAISSITAARASAAAALAAVSSAGAATAVIDGARRVVTEASDATPASRLVLAAERLASPAAWLELLLAFGVAAALASALAFHPRRKRRRVASKPSDERKALLVFSMVGAGIASLAVAAEAVGGSAGVWIAVATLGLGLVARPKTGATSAFSTGQAMLALLIGLACGLSQYAVAIIACGACWAAVWMLEARRGAEVRVRLAPGADREKAEIIASHALRAARCHVRSLRAGASGRSFTLGLGVPHSLEDGEVCQRLRERLAAEIGHAEIEIRSES